MIRDHALRLSGHESAAKTLVEKLDAADLSAEKGEQMLRLLEVREGTDALLSGEAISPDSKKELKRIRKLIQRFLTEICLKNVADLSAKPVK